MARLILLLHRQERLSFTRAFQARPLSGADRFVYPYLTAVILLRTAVNVSFALTRLSLGDARSAAAISEATLGVLFLAWLALPALLRAGSPADARLDAQRILLFPLTPAFRAARDILSVLTQPVLWLLAAATAGAFLPVLGCGRPLAAVAALLLLLSSCILVFRGLDALGGRPGAAASARAALGALLRTFPVLLAVLNPEFRVSSGGVSAIVFFTVRVPLTRPDGGGLLDLLGSFLPSSWAVRAAAGGNAFPLIPLALLAGCGAVLSWRSSSAGAAARPRAVPASRPGTRKRPGRLWAALPPVLHAELAAALRRPETAFTLLAGAALAVYCLRASSVPEVLPAGCAAAVTILASGAVFRPVPPERRLRYGLLPVSPREEARARAVSGAAPALAACIPLLAADAVLSGPAHGAALLAAVLWVLALGAAAGTFALAALEDPQEPARGSAGRDRGPVEPESGGATGVVLAAALWLLPYLLWKRFGGNPAILAAAMAVLAAAAAAAYAFTERAPEGAARVSRNP